MRRCQPSPALFNAAEAIQRRGHHAPHRGVDGHVRGDREDPFRLDLRQSALAPSAEKERAIARPIPLTAPVMTTTWPAIAFWVTC